MQLLSQLCTRVRLQLDEPGADRQGDGDQLLAVAINCIVRHARSRILS